MNLGKILKNNREKIKTRSELKNFENKKSKLLKNNNLLNKSK